MKKKSLSLALVFVMLVALLPMGIRSVRAAETEITALSLSIASPRPGLHSTETPPEVTLPEGPYTLVACSWLEDLNIYSSQTPDFTFRFSQTYYAYVLLRAAEGYVFRKSETIYSGNDEGFSHFDGCAVTGGELAFAASRTYQDGDYLRLKISVRSFPTGIGEVSFTVAPPLSGQSAAETDAMGSVTLPDGQHCRLTDAGWYQKVFDDLYECFEGTFAEGETYYLALDFASDTGYMFNQGGPNGYTGVRVTGGEPIYDFLSVTNMMDEEGNPLSIGNVLVAVTAVKAPAEDPDNPDNPDNPDVPDIPDPLFGDVDFDGAVTASDARLALRRAVELEDYAEDSDAFFVSDVDFDGKVTASDARAILRAAVGLEDPADWLAVYKARGNQMT